MHTQRTSKIHASSPTASAVAAKAQAALRMQVKLELQNKKQCAYKPYECTQLTLDNYNYCLRHILEDKSAPFKQCSYVYTANGKRCYMPAPKSDKKEYGNGNYCNEHGLKTHLTRARHGARHPPPQTAEVLLHSLSHYVRKPRTRTISSSTQLSDDTDKSITEEGEVKATKCLDPIADIDATSINASCSDILDMCSESESDVEPATFSSVWHDAHGDSSDNESIDSEQEDLLKHANVYTAEEITLVTKEKLIRLQSLYIEQYRHLQHILKEKRRKYLQALKREKETCCSIQNQVRDGVKEQRLYKKLKAYNMYHRKSGVEAILNKKLHDLRLKVTDGVAPKPHSVTKCGYMEGGVKCGERALPVTRHCRKHILEDPNQVLFRSCGKTRADVECKTPIEAIFDDATCRLHMDIPPMRSYSQLRKDSDSDYDETLDPNTSLAYNTNIANYNDTQIKMDIGLDDIKSNSAANTLLSSNMLRLKQEELSLDCFENNSDTSTTHMVIDEQSLRDDSSDMTVDVKEEAARDPRAEDLTAASMNQVDPAAESNNGLELSGCRSADVFLN